MQDYVFELRKAVERAAPLLRAIPDDKTAQSPETEKWSARQIIGHLIDSAANNHRRFILAQFQEDLIFPGYEQEVWVEAQAYNEAPFGRAGVALACIQPASLPGDGGRARRGENERTAASQSQRDRVADGLIR